MSASCRFVVTGFGAFHGVPKNPTSDHVGFLNSLRSQAKPTKPADAPASASAEESKGPAAPASAEGMGLNSMVDIVGTAVLETSAEGSLETLRALRAAHRDAPDSIPTVWLHLGVSSRDSFSVERQAINEATFRVADERGVTKSGEPIIAGHPLRQALRTRFDVDRLAAELNTPGAPVQASDDCGLFVCNWSYYNQLAEFDGAARHYVLFVHTPSYAKVDQGAQRGVLVRLLNAIATQICAPAADAGATATHLRGGIPAGESAAAEAAAVADDIPPPLRQLHVHLTGFGVFDGVADNPTTQLMNFFRERKAAGRGTHDVTTPQGQVRVCLRSISVLKVAAAAATKSLDALHEAALADEAKAAEAGAALSGAGSGAGAGGVDSAEGEPKVEVVWLHFGVWPDIDSFQLENQGINEASFFVPDEEGVKLWHVPVVDSEEYQKTRPTGVDVDAIFTASAKAGFPVSKSWSAEFFLCNYIYYKSLKWAAEQSGPRRHNSLFVHVPEFTDISEEKQRAFAVNLLDLLAVQAFPAAPPPAPTRGSAPHPLVKSMMGLGFDKDTSRRALAATDYTSVEAAMEWMFAATSRPAGAIGASVLDTGGMAPPSTRLKYVLVVNQSLSMGKGKVASQCSHATLATYKKLLRVPSAAPLLAQWEANGEPTVVVKADSDDQMVALLTMAESLSLPTSHIQDAGRTQVARGSLTVIGVGPGPDTLVNRVTGSLKLL